MGIVEIEPCTSARCMKVSGGHLPGLFDAAGELLAIHSGAGGDQP